jgi:coronin-1B/1C/6
LWDGVKLTKSAWDSNWVTASSKWVAIAWQTAGGGAVGILDASKPGKLEPTQVPLVSGHKGAVLDLEFDPFNDDILATCSEDCTAKLWKIPDGGLNNGAQLTTDVQTLKGHKRKVGVVKFHPIVENLIATAGQDYEIKVWDIESGSCKNTTVGHSNIIQSLDWNYNGSLLCSNAKDKKVRVIDPRQQSIAAEGNSHVGVKGGRALWLGKHDKIVTVGFGTGASREYMIWDTKNMSTPIVRQGLDNAAGVICPFYDEDSDLLFFAGKGDGGIRYYEVLPDEEPSQMIFEVSTYRTNDPTAGCGALYRRHCNVSVNEIIRLYQVTGTQCRPLSFQVPRKSDLFQDDLYPPCRGDEPNLTLDAWLSGENATPKLVNLEGGFKPSAKTEKKISKVEDDKELSATETKQKLDELTKRVAFLEAELAKRDAKIKELEGH